MSELEGWLIFICVWVLLFSIFMGVVTGMYEFMESRNKEQENG